MSPDLPTWLAELPSPPAKPSEAFREDWPDEVMVGDIVVLEGGDGMRRLAMISEVGEGSAMAMLAGVDTEVATSTDAILCPDESGLDYDLVVLTRFETRVAMPEQVARRVGATDDGVIRDIFELQRHGGDAQVSIRAGVGLGVEIFDERWTAVRALSGDLLRLNEYADDILLAPRVFDDVVRSPQALAAAIYDHPLELIEYLQSPVELVEGDAQCIADALDRLSDDLLRLVGDPTLVGVPLRDELIPMPSELRQGSVLVALASSRESRSVRVQRLDGFTPAGNRHTHRMFDGDFVHVVYTSALAA